jgi:acetyl-CoA carboxylase/biotin carboxylase 1
MSVLSQQNRHILSTKRNFWVRAHDGKRSLTALAATHEDSPIITSDQAQLNKDETTTTPSLVDLVGDYCAKHGGDRPIRKILIANNGMAATKSIMSMRQWAYMEVMQCGDDDDDAPLLFFSWLLFYQR